MDRQIDRHTYRRNAERLSLLASFGQLLEAESNSIKKKYFKVVVWLFKFLKTWVLDKNSRTLSADNTFGVRFHGKLDYFSVLKHPLIQHCLAQNEIQCSIWQVFLEHWSKVSLNYNSRYYVSQFYQEKYLFLVLYHSFITNLLETGF